MIFPLFPCYTVIFRHISQNVNFHDIIFRHISAIMSIARKIAISRPQCQYIYLYIYIKTIDPLKNYNFDYCFKATAGPNFPIPTSPGQSVNPAWQLAAAAQLPGPRPSYQCQGHQRHRGPPVSPRGPCASGWF